MSMLPHSLAAPRTDRTTQPVYNPLTEGRRCSSCGSTTAWRRLEIEPVGGWVCCLPDALRSTHPQMHHECGPACTLVGGAA
jgi:hypothetical protein